MGKLEMLHIYLAIAIYFSFSHCFIQLVTDALKSGPPRYNMLLCMLDQPKLYPGTDFKRRVKSKFVFHILS